MVEICPTCVICFNFVINQWNAVKPSRFSYYSHITVGSRFQTGNKCWCISPKMSDTWITFTGTLSCDVIRHHISRWFPCDVNPCNVYIHSPITWLRGIYRENTDSLRHKISLNVEYHFKNTFEYRKLEEMCLTYKFNELELKLCRAFMNALYIYLTCVLSECYNLGWHVIMAISHHIEFQPLSRC